jgi:hypothetical protein
MINKINDLIYEKVNKYRIVWVPSHKGIRGNEIADQLARNAIELHGRFDRKYRVNLGDLLCLVARCVHNEWDNNWKNNFLLNKLRQIRDNTLRYTVKDGLSSNEMKIITRLRLGHTRLTHKHLLTKDPIPICACGCEITVNHIFTCQFTATIRQSLDIEYASLMTFEVQTLKKVVEYIKTIGLFDDI